jgi:Spy/CpxP family protein refolding chaperone
MRSKRTLSLAALFLAALPFVVSAAHAEPGEGPGGPGGPGRRLERMIQTLGLNATQQQKVQAILDAAKPKREEIRGQMRKAFDEMRALLDQDTPEQAAVLAQADRIGAISTEAHKAMLTTLLAVRAELTPEQRAKLKEEMQKHGPGRWHRKHRGGASGGAGAPGAPPSGAPPEPPPED